jgi:MFS transporter, Spinster family, sphingosine-1-phosphate transporter
MKGSRYKWLVVALLWMVALLNYLDRQVIFAVFPLLKNELRVSSVELGFLGTSFLWVYGLLSPFGGYVADRFGRRRVILFSLAVWSAITWLTGHVRSYHELLLARAGMGISEACYLPAALALVADFHDEKPARGRSDCIRAGCTPASR